MRIQKLRVYQKAKLDTGVRKEIDELDRCLSQVICETRDYASFLPILKEKADSFLKRGIYTDIYYKIFNLENRVLDCDVPPSKLRKIRNIYDVYSECIFQKDYRNAARMLRYYELYNPNNPDLILLQWARIYTKLSDFEKAEEKLEQCRESQGENPTYLLTELELLFKKKEYKKVVAMLPLLDHYDGRCTYQAYVTVAQACLLLKRTHQAKRVFSMIRNIVNDSVFSDRLIESLQDTVERNGCQIYPTKKNLSTSFYIAWDAFDVGEAERYLNLLLGKDPVDCYKESDRDKIKMLGELKKKVESDQF